MADRRLPEPHDPAPPVHPGEPTLDLTAERPRGALAPGVAAGGASWSLGELSRQAGQACLSAALDSGVGVVDTAGAYTRTGVGHHNEELIAEVVARRHGAAPGGDRPVVVTKCGHHRTGATTWDVDARPQVLRTDVEGSLRALGTDVLDVCLLHWPDPDVPLEESVGALVQMRQEGLVARVGVCNVTADQLRSVLTTVPDPVVQVRLSALGGDLDDEQGDGVLGLCRASGVTVMGYSPFGGPGRLSAVLERHRQREGQRGWRPLAVVGLAQRWERSVHHLLLAWLLRTHPDVTAVAGSTRPGSITDAAAAARAGLSDAQHVELSAAVAGLRAEAAIPPR